MEVTKTDGTKKEFETTQTTFFASNYTDSFFSDGMEDAVVKVKAYGEDGTFSLWSKGTTVEVQNMSYHFGW